jgi:ribosome-associated heat shock protein Hsp15
MNAGEDVRVDKWLWAVRVFKTRSLAIEACQAGHVKLGEQRVKPARSVRVGDVFTVQLGELTRTLKVIDLLKGRVGAGLVKHYAQDLTPPSEYQKAKDKRLEPLFHRPKGAGRPTKRDRRLLDSMRGASEG